MKKERHGNVQRQTDVFGLACTCFMSKCTIRHVPFKLRKATISFVMSVATEQLGCQWTDCCEIWYWSIFRKSVEKINILLTLYFRTGEHCPIN